MAVLENIVLKTPADSHGKTVSGRSVDEAIDEIKQTQTLFPGDKVLYQFLSNYVYKQTGFIRKRSWFSLDHGNVTVEQETYSVLQEILGYIRDDGNIPLEFVSDERFVTKNALERVIAKTEQALRTHLGKGFLSRNSISMYIAHETSKTNADIREMMRVRKKFGTKMFFQLYENLSIIETGLDLEGNPASTTVPDKILRTLLKGERTDIVKDNDYDWELGTKLGRIPAGWLVPGIEETSRLIEEKKQLVAKKESVLIRHISENSRITIKTLKKALYSPEDKTYLSSLELLWKFLENTRIDKKVKYLPSRFTKIKAEDEAMQKMTDMPTVKYIGKYDISKKVGKRIYLPFLREFHRWKYHNGKPAGEIVNLIKEQKSYRRSHDDLSKATIDIINNPEKAKDLMDRNQFDLIVFQLSEEIAKILDGPLVSQWEARSLFTSFLFDTTHQLIGDYHRDFNRFKTTKPLRKAIKDLHKNVMTYAEEVWYEKGDILYIPVQDDFGVVRTTKGGKMVLQLMYSDLFLSLQHGVGEVRYYSESAKPLRPID